MLKIARGFRRGVIARGVRHPQDHLASAPRSSSNRRSLPPGVLAQSRPLRHNLPDYRTRHPGAA